MASNLPAIIGALISDLLQVPGGASLQVALERVMERRFEGARKVLLEELRGGRITEFEAAAEDELAAILFRYGRAAQEGAARRNLRLMAQVIRGQLEAGNLVANEFLQLSEMLAALSREEVGLLGLMLKVDRESDVAGKHPTAFARWPDTVKAVVERGLFPDEDQALLAAIALGRYGVVRIETHGITGAGRSMQEAAAGPSPKLRRVAAMCDFEAAAAED